MSSELSSPITNYQLPITNYQLPITNYQFPISQISSNVAAEVVLWFLSNVILRLSFLF